MISSNPIVDASGRFLAPPQPVLERPAGPWDENRGRGVREALAGERPRAVREAETLARMNAAHPGASWHFVTHPTAGRILVSVPANDVAPFADLPQTQARDRALDRWARA